MRILIACDSFKGSLSSSEAAAACTEGLRELYPDAEVIALAVADGGEGTLEALSSIDGAEWRTCHVSNACGDTVTARWIKFGSSAFIESASAIGLPLVPAERRNPMYCSSYGLGEIIANAVSEACTKIYVGLGGSATCDGGLGMLAALGYRLHHKDGSIIKWPRGIDMIDVESIEASKPMVEIIGLCDVEAVLIGPHGASYLFAPQKGASKEEVAILDKGLTHLSGVVGDAGMSAGDGAAGGIAWAIRSMLGGRLQAGAEAILDAVGFDKQLASADMVITGEGRIDATTLIGKLPSAVLRRCQRSGVPCVAIGGCVDFEALPADHGFTEVLQTKPIGQSIEEAMLPDVARLNIIKTIRTLKT